MRRAILIAILGMGLGMGLGAASASGSALYIGGGAGTKVSFRVKEIPSGSTGEGGFRWDTTGLRQEEAFTLEEFLGFRAPLRSGRS